MNEYIESCQGETHIRRGRRARQYALFLEVDWRGSRARGTAVERLTIIAHARASCSPVWWLPRPMCWRTHFDTWIPTSWLLVKGHRTVFRARASPAAVPTGVAHVGYIPAADGVMGLKTSSARLVEVYARRPQVQESD